jgi:hypothetical protein
MSEISRNPTPLCDAKDPAIHFGKIAFKKPGGRGCWGELRRWPDARPTHNRVLPGFAYSRLLAEAIAAPQVCYRHCHASFPFPGTTKGGTSKRRGSVWSAGSVSSQGSQPPSNRFPRNACSTRLTRCSDASNFHTWWCAVRRMRSGPETKEISQGVDFSIHVSGASTAETHVIPVRRSHSFSYGCARSTLASWCSWMG